MDGTRGWAIEDLTARVQREAASDDPLTQLGAAVTVGAVLSSQADYLLDRFVQQARHAGHSWTAIGQRLDVSKQAARQRFAGRTESLELHSQLRPRLRACLAQAEREAATDGRAEIGTHHLLTGLLAEGVVAAILERRGVTADAVRRTSHRLFGAPTQPRTAAPRMGDEAICALETAVHHAAVGPTSPDSGIVDTEHLLGALLCESGSRAGRVLIDLGTDIAAIKRELGNPKPRRHRWWRHRPEATTCSFCGQPSAVVGRLVTGPGIHICARCVRIAGDILNSDDAAPLPRP